ncbi:hypothetical protein WJX74_007563 [Apatococcus lobatus]|uniref:Uncharacterized protein n=1 Tax=Apatococcus lobatus TaxID=904363 RepID=A0AAW1QDT4_9CHLO
MKSQQAALSPAPTPAAASQEAFSPEASAAADWPAVLAETLWAYPSDSHLRATNGLQGATPAVAPRSESASASMNVSTLPVGLFASVNPQDFRLPAADESQKTPLSPTFISVQQSSPMECTLSSTTRVTDEEALAAAASGKVSMVPVRQVPGNAGAISATMDAYTAPVTSKAEGAEGTSAAAQEASRFDDQQKKRLGLPQYGRRAKLRMRPNKACRRSHAASQASAKGQQHRRLRHLTSLVKDDIKAVRDGQGQGPDSAAASQYSRLDALQQLCDLTKWPGYASGCQGDALKPFPLQEGCIHPGWQDVVPCQSSIVAVYQALELGNLDLIVHFPGAGTREPATLRQLAEVPFEDLCRQLAHSSQSCVNAMTFMKADGDACHLTMLKHTGLIALLGSVYFQQKGRDPTLCGKTGRELLAFTAPMASYPSVNELKAFIKLDARQTWLARNLWAQICSTVECLEAERQRLVCILNSADVQLQARHMYEGSQACRISRAMGIAAQITENEKLQQAAVRRGCRIFVWQICSPDNAARLICASSPYAPDLTAALRTIAATTSR